MYCSQHIIWNNQLNTAHLCPVLTDSTMIIMQQLRRHCFIFMHTLSPGKWKLLLNESESDHILARPEGQLRSKLRVQAKTIVWRVKNKGYRHLSKFPFDFSLYQYINRIANHFTTDKNSCMLKAGFNLAMPNSNIPRMEHQTLYKLYSIGYLRILNVCHGLVPCTQWCTWLSACD